MLVNPSLDESMFLRLRSVKGGCASKANIDAVEKQQRKLCYKVIDLAKPLLFQFRSKLRPGKARAVRTALKLWTVLFRDILQDRRRNILKQTYPDYANLLDDAKAGPGGEELFGRKFLKRLKSEAKAQNTLDAIRRKAPAANRRGTDQSRAGRNNGQSAPGYVDISSVSNVLEGGSFGGRISRFIEAWQGITMDPWILQSVEYGVTIEFSSDPVQFSIPHNGAMSERCSEFCAAEVKALVQKGAVVRASSKGFCSAIFLVPKGEAWRPIINLKALNAFIKPEKFKMEGVETVCSTVRRGVKIWPVGQDRFERRLSNSSSQP